MLVTLLKAKLHRATVTDANLNYEGSISIPPSLIKRAGFFINEKVLVANVNNGARFETYVISGEEQVISLNGAAAHLGKPGDKLIIMAYAMMDESAAASFTPTVVHLGDKNLPKD